MVKVKWYNSTGHLSEIYQSTKMQFAFLSAPKDGSEQCHPFVLCRDFLHDAVRCMLQKNSCSIYGFRYEYGKNPPIDLKKIRMLVTKKTLEESAEIFQGKMKTGLSLINHYESIAGWRKSKLVKIKDTGKPNVWLFVGPVGWLKSPFLISMYTFLIRLGDKHEVLSNFETTEELIEKFKEVEKLPRASNDNDLVYIKDCLNKMHLIIKNYKSLLLVDDSKGEDPIYSDSKIGISAFHDRCGIWSLCKGNCPNKELNEKIKILK